MNKLKLPRTWNDITIRQFIELKELISENSDITDFTNNINILCILCDIDIMDDVWNEIYLSELQNIFKQIEFFNHSPSSEIKHKLINFSLKEFDQLTLGEFIDIDRFLTDGIENLPKICAILYRKSTTDIFDNVILEKYDNINLNERSELFNNVSINDVFGLIDKLNSFKTVIVENYTTIFSPDYSDEPVEDDDIYAIETETKKEQLQAKFSWELLIYTITNGDLTKYDAILDMNFLFVLNQLSIRKAFSLD